MPRRNPGPRLVVALPAMDSRQVLYPLAAQAKTRAGNAFRCLRSWRAQEYFENLASTSVDARANRPLYPDQAGLPTSYTTTPRNTAERSHHGDAAVPRSSRCGLSSLRHDGTADDSSVKEYWEWRRGALEIRGLNRQRTRLEIVAGSGRCGTSIR